MTTGCPTYQNHVTQIRRVIPKQLLYERDDVPHRVCKQAAAYLDAIWNLPVVNIIGTNSLNVNDKCA